MSKQRFKENNPDYDKEYRQRNKERLKRLSHKYYLDNKGKYKVIPCEKLKAKARNYYRKNRAKKLIKAKEYILNNLEKVRMMKRVYSAKRRCLIGNINRKILQEVYEENILKYDTLTCYLCKKPINFGDDSIDHIIPVSKGGSNDKENLNIAHLTCNMRKSAKSLKEIEHEFI